MLRNAAAVSESEIGHGRERTGFGEGKDKMGYGGDGVSFGACPDLWRVDVL